MSLQLLLSYRIDQSCIMLVVGLWFFRNIVPWDIAFSPDADVVQVQYKYKRWHAEILIFILSVCHRWLNQILKSYHANVFSQGAYAVLRPDQKKREKITRQAEAETKAYEKYKQERRKPQYRTTNASVGKCLQFVFVVSCLTHPKSWSRAAGLGNPLYSCESTVFMLKLPTSVTRWLKWNLCCSGFVCHR